MIDSKRKAIRILRRAKERYESGEYEWGFETYYTDRMGPKPEICLMGSLVDEPNKDAWFQAGYPRTANAIVIETLAEVIGVSPTHSSLTSWNDQCANPYMPWGKELHERGRRMVLDVINQALAILDPQPIVYAKESELVTSGD